MSRFQQYAPWHESDDEDELPLMSEQESKAAAKNAMKRMEQRLAGDVVPIKPTAPSKPEPSAAQQEGMKSIDQMIGAMRKPPIR